MFIFKKKTIKACLAMCFSAAMIIANTVPAVAALYECDGNDYFREKALEKFFTESFVISMNNTVSESASEEKEIEANKSVTYSEITETEEIPYNTVKRLNKELMAGETVTVREGSFGKKVKTFKVKYVNGKEVSREAVEEHIEVQPVDKVVEYGDKEDSNTVTTANGSLKYKYVVECTATAYDLSPEENGGYGGMTATGVPLDRGVIAVDPKVIPLGSRVYIEAIDGSWSYGYAVAADTGGAIKGKRVDLCYRTRSECIQFGRRPCRVYVL